jgi:predicted DNA-binding antitoxin AbrB/MazE fold protein
VGVSHIGRQEFRRIKRRFLALAVRRPSDELAGESARLPFEPYAAGGRLRETLDEPGLGGVRSARGETTMTINLQAIYEKGMLRPLEPLDLREQQLVTVTLTVEGGGAAEHALLDEEFLAYCDTLADDGVPLEAVRQALAKIPGALTDDVRAEREKR